MSRYLIPVSSNTPVASAALPVPAIILGADDQAAWHFLTFESVSSRLH
jgi:hypothetical protein